MVDMTRQTWDINNGWYTEGWYTGGCSLRLATYAPNASNININILELSSVPPEQNYPISPWLCCPQQPLRYCCPLHQTRHHIYKLFNQLYLKKKIRELLASIIGQCSQHPLIWFLVDMTRQILLTMADTQRPTWKGKSGGCSLQLMAYAPNAPNAPWFAFSVGLR